jgi:alanine-glyoxylate transaminase/serine-glyoxylate transaminase/serine-pyruvate transaminase
MGPGPSDVHPRVYRAFGAPVVGHLDPEFLRVMDSIQEMLRRVFCTRNRLTLSLSGTGSAGMEAALVNTVDPGDAVLVGVNGVFGSRMADIVGRIGGRAVVLERPWGEIFEPEMVARALKEHPEIRVVALVHAETSTGAHQPLAEIGRLCSQSGRLLVVDAVTSLGGLELRVDDWQIDVAYSATQKCLSCPPGLAPVTFGERALEKLRARTKKGASWYLDLSLILNYWSESSRVYHHTAPISMNYALHEALSVVVEEGLEARWRRHQLHSRALVQGLEALGFRLFAREGHRLPMLNAVWIPDGVPDAEVRRRLLQDFNLEIGAGLGPVAGKIWRIGLMGETARKENVVYFLAALETILGDLGRARERGAALEAAREVYAREAAAG